MRFRTNILLGMAVLCVSSAAAIGDDDFRFRLYPRSRSYDYYPGRSYDHLDHNEFHRRLEHQRFHRYPRNYWQRDRFHHYQNQHRYNDYLWHRRHHYRDPGRYSQPGIWFGNDRFRFGLSF